MSEIVFQISFTNCSLLASKDRIDFCILASDPVTLMNLLASSNGHFVVVRIFYLGIHVI